MLFCESIPFYICCVLFLKPSIWFAEFLNFFKTYTSSIPWKFLIDATRSSHLLLTSNLIFPYLMFFLYLYYNNSSLTTLHLLVYVFVSLLAWEFPEGKNDVSLPLYTNIMLSVHLVIKEIFIEQQLHSSHSSQHFDPKVNTTKSYPLRTYVLVEMNVR